MSCFFYLRTFFFNGKIIEYKRVWMSKCIMDNTQLNIKQQGHSHVFKCHNILNRTHAFKNRSQQLKKQLKVIRTIQIRTQKKSYNYMLIITFGVNGIFALKFITFVVNITCLWQLSFIFQDSWKPLKINNLYRSVHFYSVISLIV